ncbi:HNH endonuclease signature motif containing protein [Chryseobacterium sp.]|uniref:HNH endonuclease n=1 Tax=Chryseobacterium sp. TaxID=1871047 RepID=UPI003219A36F
MGRIKGRISKYRKTLQNDEVWEEARRKVKIRDDHQCRICGSKIGLEVHHITYYVDGSSIRGNELNHLKWLITVCNNDHKKIHKDLNHPLNPKNKFKQNGETYKGIS